MVQKEHSKLAPDAPLLPEAPIIARVRRLAIVAATSALAYSIFTTAGKSYCAGGIDADGSFTDAAGRATEDPPSCMNLVLAPSGLIYFAIVMIVIGALTRALRASDHAEAIRLIDRAAATIWVVAAASVIVSQVWFALIPLDDYREGVLVYPFPFGSVELTITPLRTSGM